jgi:hypothetical protein
MQAIFAHGSGLDELIAFLAVPALWGGFVLVRGVVRRIRGTGYPAPAPEEGGQSNFPRS